MSTYINTKTGEYPRHIGDLYLIGYKDGDNLPEGWHLVIPSEKPNFEGYKKVVEVKPKLINKIWTQQWEVIDMTEDEIIMNNTPRPVDGKIYIWDKKSLSWKAI